MLTTNGTIPPFDAVLRIVPLRPGASPRVVDLNEPFRFPAWPAPNVRALRWLPRGDRLSVQLQESDNATVTVELGLNGTSGAHLLSANALAVDWAIDGRVALIRDGNLRVSAPDGYERQLTVRGADQPSWSPHGKWIAFVRSNSVFVVPGAGGRARRLARGSEPVWAPDGRSIAFLHRAPDPYGPTLGAVRFYLYNWRTKRIRKLTLPLGGTYDLQIASPEWQPLPR
jgi:Tol biopolymer transport system component